MMLCLIRSYNALIPTDVIGCPHYWCHQSRSTQLCQYRHQSAAQLASNVTSKKRAISSASANQLLQLWSAVNTLHRVGACINHRVAAVLIVQRTQLASV